MIKLTRVLKNLKMKHSKIWLNSLKNMSKSAPELLRTSTLERESFIRELISGLCMREQTRCIFTLLKRSKITWLNKPESLLNPTQKISIIISEKSLTLDNSKEMMIMTFLKRSHRLMPKNTMKCGLQLKTITKLKNQDLLNWELKVVPVKKILKRWPNIWTQMQSNSWSNKKINCSFNLVKMLKIFSTLSDTIIWQIENVYFVTENWAWVKHDQVSELIDH